MKTKKGFIRRRELAMALLMAPLTFTLASTQAHATQQITPDVTLDTILRAQAFDQNNGDVDTTGDRNGAGVGGEARFKLTAHMNPDALVLLDGRAVASAGHNGFQNTDTGTLTAGNNFLELRQAYVELGNENDASLFGRLGRQLFREETGLWWNQDFDAFSLNYKSTLFKGTVAAGQNLSTWATGADNKFLETDRDLARFFAEGSWQYYYENFIEARAMYLDDHSGRAHVGSTEDALNPNDDNGHLFWGGLRATGSAHSFIPDADKIAYRADVMAVAGKEKVNTTTPAGGGLVTVTGANDNTVRGWAFDSSLDVPLAVNATQLHFGYSYGSGDGDAADTTDHAFRQTGLEGNFSRFGALSRNADTFGTVLRPDLSNLHVFALGATRPLLSASDGGIVYRYYRLADNATSVVSSGVATALNGDDKDLGHGLDLLFNMDIKKEFNLDLGHIQDLDLRTSLGGFRTGEAYGSNSDKTIVRALAEVRLAF